MVSALTTSSAQGQTQCSCKPHPFDARSEELKRGLRARNVDFKEREDDNRKWIRDSALFGVAA